mmetsp:Transcript_104451/g.277924  ORF Transcript_104451/g.277924 Transcript_104451/m.277924 type:complete len:408 (+) Transcript_104451:1533-2756(+)
MRCSFSCCSIFHLCRSFPSVLACDLCLSTSSTCWRERSSALITDLLRMSRSCSRSTICLLSTSACRFSCSISRVSDPISVLSSLREPSRRWVSESSPSFFFLMLSNCFWSFPLDPTSALMSLCLARSWSCRSMFSLESFSRPTSSSWCDFFSDSLWLSRRSWEAFRRSISWVSSLSCFSRWEMTSLLRLISSLLELISFCRCSMFCRRSLRSLSRVSLRFWCLSPSSTRCCSWSCRLWSSLFPDWRSTSSFCTLEVRSPFVEFSCCTCPCSMSRCLMRSFFSWTSWLTMFSWLMLRPAPCSTSRPSLEISPLRFWMVSLARCSFSWEVSTIFHALSISFFRAVIVDWSSCESFSAVCTFTAFCTISVLSSRHFLMRCFSLSWDFLRARCNFSYSWRKCSSDLSPTSS